MSSQEDSLWRVADMWTQFYVIRSCVHLVCVRIVVLADSYWTSSHDSMTVWCSNLIGIIWSFSLPFMRVKYKLKTKTVTSQSDQMPTNLLYFFPQRAALWEPIDGIHQRPWPSPSLPSASWKQGSTALSQLAIHTVKSVDLGAIYVTARSEHALWTTHSNMASYEYHL